MLYIDQLKAKMEFITSIFAHIKKEQDRERIALLDKHKRLSYDNVENDNLFIYTYAPRINKTIVFKKRNIDDNTLYCDKKGLLLYIQHERNPIKISFFEENIYECTKYSRDDVNTIIRYYYSKEYSEDTEKVIKKITEDFKVLQSRYKHYNSYLTHFDKDCDINIIYRKFLINFLIIIKMHNISDDVEKIRLTKFIQFWNYINNNNMNDINMTRGKILEYLRHLNYIDINVECLNKIFVPLVFECYFKNFCFYKYFFIDSIFSRDKRHELYNIFFEVIINDNNIKNVDLIVNNFIKNIPKLSYLANTKTAVYLEPE